MPRLQAAIVGANEVGFTVLSISLSLIAVFAPLIFFGGIVGRLFNEFALTLSAAVMISLVVSLTTTPMMCALILPRESDESVTAASIRLRSACSRPCSGSTGSRSAWRSATRHFVALTLLATIWLNYDLFRYHISYGLFPVQDTGLIIGAIQADQSIRFQSMEQKFKQLQTIVQEDPAVANVVGFTGGRQTNSGFIYVSLKPYAERKVTADGVVDRLRGKLAKVAGARLFMFAVSDLRTGGRQSNATYQYTLLSDDAPELAKWTPKLTEALHEERRREGRQLRPAAGRTRDRHRHRPRHGDAARADAERDRQHALRRLRPAAGFRHLQRAEPVSRGDGGRAALLAGPAHARQPLRLDRRRQPDRDPADRLRGGTPHVEHRDAKHRGLDRGGRRAQPRNQRAGRERPYDRLDRVGGLVLRRDDGSAVRLRPPRARPHPPQRQSPGPVPRRHDLVQSRARQVAERGADGDRRRDQAHRHAVDGAWRLRRHRGHLSAVAVEHADAVRLGAADDLHRARHPLREPDPSDHDPLDAVLGERRRRARAVAVRHALHGDRGDRRAPADRHREEERDHDGRFRARCGAAAGPRHARGDRAGLPPALPSDHDDDVRGDLRRPAPRLRNGRGIGACAIRSASPSSVD